MAELTDTFFQAGVHDVGRSLHVDLVHSLLVARHEGNHRCRVNHVIHVRQSFFQRQNIQDIAFPPIDLAFQIAQQRAVGAWPVQRGDRMALGQKSPGGGAARESGSAGDQNSHKNVKDVRAGKVRVSVCANLGAIFEIKALISFFDEGRSAQAVTFFQFPPPASDPIFSMKKLFTNLTFWVLTAIATGALLGHFYPETAQQMRPLGTGFIDIVKLFINPIIFLTISLGISGMGDLKKVGKVGGKALLYFEVVTTFALVIGVAVAYLIRPGDGVVTDGMTGGSAAGDVSKFAQEAEKGFSMWEFFKNNLTIQVLLFSILFGVFLSKYQAKQRVVDVLNYASKYVFKALHFVMIFAPIGAFGGMAFTIGKYGIKTLLPLGKLMLTVYTTMGLFIFVVLFLILRYYKISLLKYLNYIREELLVVLGTSSSEAGLPLAHGKTRTHGLLQTHRRAGGAGGLLLQPRRHDDLPLDGDDFPGAGLWRGTDAGPDVHHHRHPDGDLQGRSGRHGQRLRGAGFHAHGHQGHPAGRTGAIAGCGIASCLRRGLSPISSATAWRRFGLPTTKTTSTGRR